MNTFYRVLIAGFTGLLTVISALLLVIDTFRNMIGGQGLSVWFFIIPLLPLLGLFLLGLTNTSWLRAILSSFLALFIATVVFLGTAIVFSMLEGLIVVLHLEEIVLLAAIHVAALVGTTELLTRSRVRQTIHILRALGLTLLIVVGFEIIRNATLLILSDHIIRNQSVTGTVMSLYTVITAINTVFLIDKGEIQSGSKHHMASTIMWVIFNCLVFLFVILTGLLT